MRLIDADELKINMDKGMQGTARDYLKFYQMAVDDQPTAYDPDKIVEQLEKESYDSGKLYGYFKDHNTYEVGGYQDGISKAIEIVKGGGSDGR